MQLGLGSSLLSQRGVSGGGVLTPPTLKPVVSFSGNELSKELYVSWTASNKTSSPGFVYVLETSNDDGETWDYFTETTGLDSEMTLTAFPDGDYLIRVVPANDAGMGTASDPVAVTLPLPMAAPVVNVEVEYLSYDVLITWTAVPGATAYSIDYQVDGGGWSNLAFGIEALSHLDTGFSGSPGAYEFRVRGTNGFGEGPWSDPAGVTLPGESEAPEVTGAYLTPDSLYYYTTPDGSQYYQQPA